MMFSVLMVIAAGALLLDSANAAKATYSCFNDGTTRKISFQLVSENNETISSVYGLDMAQNCSNTDTAKTITGIGSKDDPFSLVIDVSGSTQVPECGATKVQGEVFEVKVVQQKSETILQASDLVYTVRCDFANASNTEVTLKGIELNGGFADQGNATENVPSVTMELFDVAKNKSEQFPSLGMNMKLILRLDEETAGYATGIRVVSVVASADEKFEVTEVLFDESGCSKGNGPFKAGLGFKGQSPKGMVAESPEFRMFKFITADTVFIKAKIQFCTSGSNVTCSGDQCRKARSRRDIVDEVQKSELPSEAEVRAVVVVKSDIESRNQGRSGTGIGIEEPEEKVVDHCIHYITFLVTLSILVFVMLLSFGTAIFFCRRASANKSKDRMENKIVT